MSVEWVFLRGITDIERSNLPGFGRSPFGSHSVLPNP